VYIKTELYGLRVAAALIEKGITLTLEKRRYYGGDTGDTLDITLSVYDVVQLVMAIEGAVPTLRKEIGKRRREATRWKKL
jgi:hypothetical protein